MLSVGFTFDKETGEIEFSGLTPKSYTRYPRIYQPIDVLQQEFSQEKLLVSCKENEPLSKFLDDKQYQYTFENNVFRVKTNDKINNVEVIA